VKPTPKPIKKLVAATSDPIRFGTVSAPTTTPKPGGTPLAIQHIRVLGLDHLEIAWVQSVRVTDEACAEIKATAEVQAVSLSIHAPYYINLNSLTDDLMGKSDERLLAAARKGYLAGARDIVFHPGSYHEQDPAAVYPRVRDQLAHIAATLRAEGVDVTLRPETMGKTAMFGTLEEAIALSRDIPGVLPAIDFAHLHARTGKNNTYEEFVDMLNKVHDGLGRAALENLHIHLSGIEYGPKGEKNHIPLNEADMNYRDLLQALVDFDARGVIAVEAPDPFHVADALTLQATYRRLRAKKQGVSPEASDAETAD
jgi:deoxyribonuclease-4